MARDLSIRERDGVVDTFCHYILPWMQDGHICKIGFQLTLEYHQCVDEEQT